LEILRIYSYEVIGKPEVLFLLGNWNFVVGTNVEDLRNKVALVENPRTAMGIRRRHSYEVHYPLS